MLAKAVTTNVKKPLFAFSTASLASEYVGGSEKNVQEMFRAAAEQDGILFIDEIDAICGKRGPCAGAGQDDILRLKTQMLAEMEGISSKSVFVIAATNRPDAIDTAILRRFKRHIYVELPNFSDRKQLFEMYLGKFGAKFDGKDYHEFAEKTELYSGADISVVCGIASNAPSRKFYRANSFKVLANGNVAPLSGTPDASCFDAT